MSDMLSQDEINALLNGMNEEESKAESESPESEVEPVETPSEAAEVATPDDDIQEVPAEAKDASAMITDEERDAVGEISNISMGTSATTLSSVLNQKVNITTPKVETSSWKEIVDNYEKPLVAVQIAYKEGLEGNNILFLKEDDVKIITDLMMGGDGSNTADELSELHLSAISEAMNQMVGSSSTSLSQMFDKKVDIAPPISKRVLHEDKMAYDSLAEFLKEDFIKVSFRLVIGDLIDSELMQLYPLSFVDEITENFNYYKHEKEEPKAKEEAAPAPAAAPPPQPVAPPPQAAQPQMQATPPPQPRPTQVMGGAGTVDVQRAQFENFEYSPMATDRSNIELIMDVPLNVTVELGRTHKSIKEILDFSPGTIIELDKIAGEPIDVLVNGKIVAKGEVVVIAENFSIRLTDIIKGNTNININ